MHRLSSVCTLKGSVAQYVPVSLNGACAEKDTVPLIDGGHTAHTPEKYEIYKDHLTRFNRSQVSSP